jgi:2-(1,2-epoxy-1,2-dihydrophenyl)acetyl-CoA isomerase
MLNETVIYVVNQSIATITLNRPQQLNAMDHDMMLALREALTQAQDDAIRVVVIRGAGRAFIAGGDVATFAAQIDELSALLPREIGLFHESTELIRALKKPVIASVHGACAGGGLSLMLACDLAIAAQNAKFTMAYANIGTSPDGGASFFLPRVVGARRAMELMLLADRFDADAAQRLGIINMVVADDALEAQTAALAARLSRGPTHAYANTKALIGASFERDLTAQLHAEMLAFADCATGADFKEGVKAFVEKRTPTFEGV